MPGRGTGIPIAFVCPVARRTRDQLDRNYGYPSGHKLIVRTGRTRPAPGLRNLPPRKLPTSHEYRCECGHTGWTCHSDITSYPLRSAQ